jgi:hypothetical protein
LNEDRTLAKTDRRFPLDDAAGGNRGQDEIFRAIVGVLQDVDHGHIDGVRGVDVPDHVSLHGSGPNRDHLRHAAPIVRAYRRRRPRRRPEHHLATMVRHVGTRITPIQMKDYLGRVQ